MFDTLLPALVSLIETVKPITKKLDHTLLEAQGQQGALQISFAEIGSDQIGIVQDSWWDLARKSIAQNKSYNN